MPGGVESHTLHNPVLVSCILPPISTITQVLLHSSFREFSVVTTYLQTHHIHPAALPSSESWFHQVLGYIFNQHKADKTAQQSAMILWHVMPLAYRQVVFRAM